MLTTCDSIILNTSTFSGVVNIRKSTHPLEQMDFPLLYEGILNHFP